MNGFSSRTGADQPDEVEKILTRLGSGAVVWHETPSGTAHAKICKRGTWLITLAIAQRSQPSILEAHPAFAVRDVVTTAGQLPSYCSWFRSSVELLQKRGLWRDRRTRVFRVATRSPGARKLVVVHTGVIPVPPIRATGNHGLAPQPSTTSIAVAAIVARPPSQTYSDEAVIEAMVVMGEVIVIAVVAVPVLAMPIVAMPIIIAMPCRAAMPATTAPSTNTGDVSATYSASVDVAAADVADVSSANMDAAHVADVASAYMDAAHAAATHPTPEMASSAVAGIRLTDQARDK